MGFYYGSDEPPPEEPNGSWGDVIAITWAVFRALSLPLAIIFGVVAFLFLTLWLFTVSPWFGLLAVLAVVGAVAARGLWEWRHPPRLEDIDFQHTPRS